jgi:hypothetical protein
VHHRYQDPFADYKARLKRRLAKKDGLNAPKAVNMTSQDHGVNWFGVKVREGGNPTVLGKRKAGGVGKYLNSHTILASPTDEPNITKKQRLGFGDFEGW